jgi:hypothetical protein
MTAEEKLEEIFSLHINRGASYVYGHTEVLVIQAMQEYALMKCKQLLEIVADKARINFSNDKANDFGINKDSILNCVDLEKFCK